MHATSNQQPPNVVCTATPRHLGPHRARLHHCTNFAGTLPTACLPTLQNSLHGIKTIANIYHTLHKSMNSSPPSAAMVLIADRRPPPCSPLASPAPPFVSHSFSGFRGKTLPFVLVVVTPNASCALSSCQFQVALVAPNLLAFKRSWENEILAREVTTNKQYNKEYWLHYRLILLVAQSDIAKH